MVFGDGGNQVMRVEPQNCVPSNSFGESLTPKVIVFGDEAFRR